MVRANTTRSFGARMLVSGLTQKRARPSLALRRSLRWRYPWWRLRRHVSPQCEALLSASPRGNAGNAHPWRVWRPR